MSADGRRLVASSLTYNWVFLFACTGTGVCGGTNVNILGTLVSAYAGWGFSSPSLSLSDDGGVLAIGSFSNTASVAFCSSTACSSLVTLTGVSGGDGVSSSLVIQFNLVMCVGVGG
jgi:hypothetical protein